MGWEHLSNEELIELQPDGNKPLTAEDLRLTAELCIRIAKILEENPEHRTEIEEEYSGKPITICHALLSYSVQKLLTQNAPS